MAQKFKPDLLIRNKKNGDPFIVVHVYRNCTMIVDARDPHTPATIMVLLPRDYIDFAPDQEMQPEYELSSTPGEDIEITWSEKIKSALSPDEAFEQMRKEERQNL